MRDDELSCILISNESTALSTEVTPAMTVQTDRPTTGTARAITADQGPARWGAAVFAGVALMFALYPAVRPYADETTLAGAEAMASSAWVAAHSFAMVGFVLLVAASGALRRVLRGTPGARLAWQALATTGLGVAFTMPYYGMETFGLHAVGTRAVQAQDASLLELADAMRFGSVQLTTFAVGLVLLAVGTGLLAAAVRRSRMLPRWSGMTMAVAFALFVPQFYAPPGIRIAHGMLLAVGALILATALWRAGGSRPGQAASAAGSGSV